MILAAAKAATKSHWWDDWLKFVPGWLAFVLTMGTLIHKWWTRRQRLAVGPDVDELRELLVSFRGWFSKPLDLPVTQHWLLKRGQHTDAPQQLRDLMARRSDRTLIGHLDEIAGHWAEFTHFGVPDQGITRPGPR
ncbi:hypothetical protein E5082_05430 [Streptomyces griseoluteus]|uniref:Uncharacterized protein n=1 Tax=Streptomyces griseoluteus TaxID=29306 RepID=A0A4Z1DLG1_STRGP|nr:hypothetical protein [Streptomyces griseoluteus]TGN85555.1 hypothetical protein E5082_05430 [Streptomyces griseoluteus]GHE92927.1 hypothetical protein GCM10017776_06750 [Streptomyces griseoluteus]